MLNKVNDFKRIWDFVGRRDFSQEKLHFVFSYFFLFCFFFFLAAPLGLQDPTCPTRA